MFKIERLLNEIVPKHVLTCPNCEHDNLLPIVYGDTLDEIAICKLHWAYLGSKILGPPYQSWYCASCTHELVSQQVVVKTAEFVVDSVDVDLVHSKLIKQMTDFYKSSSPDCSPYHGRKWTELLSKVFERGYTSLIVYQPLDGVSTGVASDSLSNYTLPTMTSETYNYISNFLISEKNDQHLECLEQIYIELRNGLNLYCCIYPDRLRMSTVKNC